MDENKLNAFTEGGMIYLHATNIEQFRELVELAENQAQQLNDTIARLRNFKFNFKFTNGKQS